MNNEDAAILQEQAYEVMETVEDNVEYLCDEYMMSGEKVWVMISALCEAKLAHFPHETFIRKLSVKTYALALKQIEYFNTIGIKSSISLY